MEKKNKTQSITKNELHKALGEYNRTIVEAIDKKFKENRRDHERMEMRFAGIGEQLKENRKDHKRIETDIVIIKTQMEDLQIGVRRIDQRTDKTFMLLEGYVKAQEDFKQDFMIIQHEVDEIKKVIKTKLGVEIN